MERLVGAGIRRKLDDARKTYKGGDKPAMKLSVYKNLIKSLKKKGLSGGASGAGWLTPWKWDSEDWKAVGVGLAYGADAVIMGALESKTVKQLIKTAISTGTSAQLLSMGIVVPPSVIAMGTDQAVDAFIAGIVMAHDYVVGDNPYREQVDAMFEVADKYAPQVIKGVEIAQSALQSGVTSILAPTGMGRTGLKNIMSDHDRMDLVGYLMLFLGAIDIINELPQDEDVKTYEMNPRIIKAMSEIRRLGIKYDLLTPALIREMEDKEGPRIQLIYDELHGVLDEIFAANHEERKSFAPMSVRRTKGGSRFSPDAQRTMIKVFQQKRLEFLDQLYAKLEHDIAHLDKSSIHDIAKIMDDEALWKKLYELHNRYVMEGRGKTIEMPIKEFKAEHKELLDVLQNPTKEKLDKELAKQTKEVSKVVSGKGMDLLGMSEAEYMKKAKSKAKKAGYDPKKLSMCSDGVHKLDYDGVKFGRVGYGDHILYSFLEKSGEAPKGTAAKKRKVFRKSHEAMKDSGKSSANQLALAILW